MELHQIRHLFTEALQLAPPADHQLASRQRIRWKDLSEQRLVVLNEMHCLGKQTMSFCRRNRADPDIVCQGNQLTTILEMVAVGMGVTLVPEMAVRQGRSTRRLYRRIADRPPSRAIVVAWHRDRYRSGATRTLVQSLRQHPQTSGT